MNHLKTFLILPLIFVVVLIVDSHALEMDSSIIDVSGDKVMFYSQPNGQLYEGNFLRVYVYGSPVASVRITKINGYYTTAIIIAGNLKKYEGRRVSLKRIDAAEAPVGIAGRADVPGIKKTRPKLQLPVSEESEKPVKKESKKSAKKKREKTTTTRTGDRQGRSSAPRGRKSPAADETALYAETHTGENNGDIRKKYPVFDPGYNNIRVKAGSFRPGEPDMQDSFTAGLEVVFPLSGDRAIAAEYTYTDPTSCTSSSPGATTHSCIFRNSFAALSLIRADQKGRHSWYYGIGGAYFIQRVDISVTMADTSYYEIISKIHEPALLLTLGYGNENGYFIEGRYALTDGAAWDPSTGKEAETGGFLLQAGYRLHK